MNGPAPTNEVAAAYSRSAAAWRCGPARVYDRLAEVLADACPVPLAGAKVLDVGAGTGAATRAAERRGAEVVAVDIALGMLEAGARHPTAAVGNALDLPFATGSFDAVLAAFSLTHLTAPAAGLREAARVLRPGGGLVVGGYAADDDHPARTATDEAARARGWVPPPWYAAIQAHAVPLMATVERAQRVAEQAGLQQARVNNERVAFNELTPEDLVRWRIGMAHLAPFVTTLKPDERDALIADAAARLTGSPPLVRSLIVLTVRASGEATRPDGARRGRRTSAARR